MKTDCSECVPPSSNSDAQFPLTASVYLFSYVIMLSFHFSFGFITKMRMLSQSATEPLASEGEALSNLRDYLRDSSNAPWLMMLAHVP
jgi:hypothetical protein